MTHLTRKAGLAAVALAVLCLGLTQPLKASGQVTVGAQISTQSPNIVSGMLDLPPGVTINDQLTNVNAVITRGGTSAGAVITVQPTTAAGDTTFSGTLVGVSGVPNQGPVGAILTLLLP